MKAFKDMLMDEIILNERLYCFDRNYCTDETWKRENGDKTREEAFLDTLHRIEHSKVNGILKFYGDKYNYVLDSYNKQNNVAQLQLSSKHEITIVQATACLMLKRGGEFLDYTFINQIIEEVKELATKNSVTNYAVKIA